MLREYSVVMTQPTTERDTIYSLLARRAAKEPYGVIAEFREPTTHRWITMSAKDMLERVHRVAKGLTALGVRPGDMVVIYAPTSYDWGVVDFACAAIGAVSVPIYDTDSAQQVARICQEVTPVVAFAGDVAHAHTLVTVFAAQHLSSYLFTFESDGVNAVIECGRSMSDEVLDRIIRRVSADDLATIVYTSSSTRQPRGVMLSHRNFTHNVFASYEALPDMLNAPSRLALFLPLAHCLARYIQYVAIGAHGVVGYLPGARHLLADMREFRPTTLFGVPRVFEKVYNTASQNARTGLKGQTFMHASRHFTQWSKDEMVGCRHSPVSCLIHGFFMLTIGSSIHLALGSNMKYLTCMGAFMNTNLVHFFNGIDGITFIQGYGLTETTALCLVNRKHANKIGTVGKPMPGIAVKLAKDHELLIKGSNVFLGYYRQPISTSQVVGPDGWLHTGNLAEIDGEGFVTITRQNGRAMTTRMRSHKTRTVGTVEHPHSEGLHEVDGR